MGETLCIARSGRESGPELPAHPCEVTAHPRQDQAAQKCWGGSEREDSSKQKEQVLVGAMEVGQGGDKQNLRFQNQANGIPALQPQGLSPYCVPGAGGDKATADPGPACGPCCPHTHHTDFLLSKMN